MQSSSNIYFKNSEDIINYIKQSTADSQDMVYRDLKVDDKTVYVVYNESVADSKTVSDFVIRSMNELFFSNEILDTKNSNNSDNENDKKKNLKDKIKEKFEAKLTSSEEKIDIDNVIKKIEKNIEIGKVKKIDFLVDDIFYYIFSGFTLVIIDTDIIALNTTMNLNRSITEPTSEKNLKGPKDAFTESYQVNIGLVRKRIKSEKLVLEEEKVGRKSKTKVGILYINDIARQNLVTYIKDKIKKIDIDAILDSNYIVELIDDSKKSDFPTTISTERPDLVSYYLLQGRVALVVENSPFVIVVPAFLTDFLNNIEDNYQKNVNIIITKIIRYIAFFITIFTPALYVALVTFDQESIPTHLLLSFATQREGVPFPAFLEAFIMIFAFEILREGDFRVPNSGGSTLSIVGALILGDAAVNAGIVSPIMIIVIAITTISGLMFTDINMSNALRAWRIILLFFASSAGLVGIGVGLLLLITKLSSTMSAAKPFTYPISPINIDSLEKSFLRRKSIAEDTKRQKILTDNLTKYKIDKEKA